MPHQTCYNSSVMAVHPQSSNDKHPAVAVCHLDDLKSRGSLKVTVHEREVALFYHRGTVHALDAMCYHSGGPLHDGKITDIEDISCVVCPWHHYKISLITGEGYYQSIDPFKLSEPPVWKSKGVKQRPHRTTVEDDIVYVELSNLDDKYESDFYYSGEYSKRMQMCPH